MSKSSKAKRKAKREVMRAAVMHNCKMHTQEGGLAGALVSRVEHAYRLGLSGEAMPVWIATDRIVKATTVCRGFHFTFVNGKGGIGYGSELAVDYQSKGRPGAFLKAYNKGS